MKTLIIGGSGFVGTELLEKLKSYDCINLDKVNSKEFSDITIIGDIRKIEDIRIDQGVTHVILLAAEHKDNIEPKSLYYDVNVVGTRNVLEQMDKHGIKNLIFTSSVAVYGLNKKNPNESFKVDPFNNYGKSKWLAEQEIEKWFKKNPNKKSVTIIRPTVIFGKGNRGNVYNLLKQIVSGNFVMIGSGKNIKSMAYVGNVVAFIESLIKNSKEGYEVFNYADKPDFNMLELVKLINQILGVKTKVNFKIPYVFGLLIGYLFDALAYVTRRKLNVSSVRIKKFCAETQFNSDKTFHFFKPPYAINDALEKTIKEDLIT